MAIQNLRHTTIMWVCPAVRLYLCWAIAELLCFVSIFTLVVMSENVPPSEMLRSTRRVAVLLTQIKPIPLSHQRHLSSLSYHSEPLRFVNSTMRVRLIPALQDNYMYLLVDDATKTCAAVDPVEPQKVVAAVKEENVTLTTVLTTHHHWDHAGGNEEMAGLVPNLTMYGGDERIKALTKIVKHGDQFKVGELSVKCLFTPCHTTGHICYYVTGPNSDDPLVFTGDTLFQGGCGRFFEGTPEQMHHALMEVLAKLPENTDVYCGHEYTVNNLKYALHVEPNNTDVQERMTWAQSQRNKNLPTIPSKIAGELKFNPFMRVNQPSVREHTGRTDAISTMGALRQEKDSFKPK